MNLTDLEAIGVKRVSVGGALARTAYGCFLRAAREMLKEGTFGFTEKAADSREITAAFQD
jgi:2-methylisocitrate lyase-like PEP mutase family enzyme